MYLPYLQNNLSDTLNISPVSNHSSLGTENLETVGKPYDYENLKCICT